MSISLRSGQVSKPARAHHPVPDIIATDNVAGLVDNDLSLVIHATPAKPAKLSV